MKLSKAQQFVIDKMRNGWELGQSNSMVCDRCCIQKGGIGRGGEAVTVSRATKQALFDRGLIRSRGYSFPTEVFELTEAACPPSS